MQSLLNTSVQRADEQAQSMREPTRFFCRGFCNQISKTPVMADKQLRGTGARLRGSYEMEM
jgi:hypothetical protein